LLISFSKIFIFPKLFSKFRDFFKFRQIFVDFFRIFYVSKIFFFLAIFVKFHQIFIDFFQCFFYFQNYFRNSENFFKYLQNSQYFPNIYIYGILYSNIFKYSEFLISELYKIFFRIFCDFVNIFWISIYFFAYFIILRAKNSNIFNSFQIFVFRYFLFENFCSLSWIFTKIGKFRRLSIDLVETFWTTILIMPPNYKLVPIID